MTEPKKREVRVGDRVRVKPGVTDLVCSEIELSGYSGVVAATDGDMCRVDWDTTTVNSMPEAYCRRWQEDALPTDHLWLPSDDLEPAG